MTDDEYATEIDAEAVAHARKPWPARGSVRRVPIYDSPGDPHLQRQLAAAANDAREREGDQTE